MAQARQYITNMASRRATAAPQYREISEPAQGIMELQFQDYRRIRPIISASWPPIAAAQRMGAICRLFQLQVRPPRQPKLPVLSHQHQRRSMVTSTQTIQARLFIGNTGLRPVMEALQSLATSAQPLRVSAQQSLVLHRIRRIIFGL